MKKIIDLLRNDTRNCKERNAKDRAERRESRFRSATSEEIGYFSWRVAIKTGPGQGRIFYGVIRAYRFIPTPSANT